MASRRKLFELLEEKQEPFLLDVYLLENGYSSKRIKRGKRVGVGFLRSILSKLVQKKPLSKAQGSNLNTFGITSREIEMEESKQLSPASALEFHDHTFKDENQSSTSSFDWPREPMEISAFSHFVKSKNVLSWMGMQRDETSLGKLLSSDMLELRSEWSSFRPEVPELGVEIEAAIFEEMVDETLLEILGMHCVS